MRAAGSGCPLCAASSQNHPQILVVQANGNARLEAAFDHPLAEQIQHAARGDAAEQRFSDRSLIQTEPRREREALGDRFRGDEQRELIAGFGGLTRSDRSEVHDALTEAFQDRSDAFEHRPLCAHHDRERALFGSCRPARHRGVDEGQAARGERPADLDGGGR